MFERFREKYAPIRDSSSAEGGTWLHMRLLKAEGYAEFAAEFAGASFGGGLYRVHDQQSGPEALTLIAEAYPEFATRVCPFGYDWLGRQLVIDSGRVVGGQPQVLLMEPGTGQALEIPSSFTALHDEEILDYSDAVLASQFFDKWSAANGDFLPLRRDQCVGYKVPLFLGGKDIAENLDLTDLDVYWSICGQMRLSVMGFPPGTPIDEVSGS